MYGLAFGLAEWPAVVLCYRSVLPAHLLFFPTRPPLANTVWVVNAMCGSIAESRIESVSLVIRFCQHPACLTPMAKSGGKHYEAQSIVTQAWHALSQEAEKH